MTRIWSAQDEAAELGVLRAVPDGQLAAFQGGRGRAPLQRHAGEPLVDDGLLDDDLAGVERGVVGGDRIGQRDVAPGRGEQQRLTREGSLGAHHRGQRIVVHRDQVGGVLALVAAIGDDHCDRLADKAHRVHRQERLRPRAAEGRRALAADGLAAVRRRRRQVGHVLDGQHRDHARLAEGRAGVDAGDARVRDRAADERHPRCPVEFRGPQVVDVHPARRQQARVLCPYHPGAQDAHICLRAVLMWLRQRNYT
jgi:hypothetical protein